MSDDDLLGLSERLARLYDLSNEANLAADGLNADFTTLANTLAEARLGIPACVAMDTDDQEDASGFTRELWFSKNDGIWRFTIQKGVEGDLSTWSSMDLVKAPKHLRLEAAEKMPKLLDALVEAAEKSVAAFEQASRTIQGLTKVVEEINRKKRKPVVPPGPSWQRTLAESAAAERTARMTAPLSPVEETAVLESLNPVAVPDFHESMKVIDAHVKHVDRVVEEASRLTGKNTGSSGLPIRRRKKEEDK